MGEISDALRRARREWGSRREKDLQPDAARGDNAVVRAGLDFSPPSELAGSAVIAEPISADEAPDADVEIAAISRTRSGLWEARAVLVDPRQPHAENFRRFAVRLRQELQRRGIKSVLVTSAVRSEGKTITSCNLALALASMAAGGRIALVELDARKPSISPALDVVPEVGIEEVITGAAPLGAARIRTELPSLDLYLVREPLADTHGILSLPSLGNVFRDLETRYDAIVVDSPPALLVPDVPLILSHVGACVAVVRAGTSRLKTARDMLDQLPSDKLLGVFVNDASAPRHARQYGYYTAKDELR